MFGKTKEHCRFCGASLEPEETHRLAVALFERTYEVCLPCRDAWNAGGRALVPFDPGFRGDRAWRWPGPLEEDALVLLRRIEADLAKTAGPPPGEVDRVLAGEGRKALHFFEEAIASGEPTEHELAGGLAAAVAAGRELAPLDRLTRLVDRHARHELTPLLLGVHAHATASVPLPQDAKVRKPQNSTSLAHLEAARSAYLMHLPFALRDELDGRIAALHVAATLALGDLDAAEAKLRGYRRQADAKPAARDPRLPVLQAFTQLASGNLAAVDDALRTALDWVRGARDPARWASVEALALHDQYARAVAAERWEAARDALKRFVKLLPKDGRALFDLAQVYLRCGNDAVAREVLAAHNALDPRDEHGVLLYGTCLVRLGETHAAWTLLRDDLETDREDEELGAERRHLAGLCAHAEGERERAIELLAASHARKPDERTRENLVFLVQEEIGPRIDELTPESFPELIRFVGTHGDVLRKEYGEAGLALVQGFVAREVRDGFTASPGFGPDLFDKVRFSDADATALQAWSLLAQRKLGDAVRKGREARAAGASPLPFDLVLRFLARIKAWPEDARRALIPGT